MARNRKRTTAATQQRRLEAVVRERRMVRAERDPLARRHLPDGERWLPADELAARDWTRPVRVAALTADVDYAYSVKRGEAR